MTGVIEVLSPGLQATIQDCGRFGFQEIGVPRCGTLVPHWMEVANFMLGNPTGSAGIEFRILGPSLRIAEGPVKIVVCAEVTSTATIHSATAKETKKISAWQSFSLDSGDEIKVSALKNSAVGFMALSGGIDSDLVLGSRSTYVRSKIGGTYLRPGDHLRLGADSARLAREPDKIQPAPLQQDTRTPIRVVLGPQADFFPGDEIEKFLSGEYTISTASDRMGARLEGNTIQHLRDRPAEIASDGVTPGAVQVPGNGQPIVLLNDGQTVGGYPKIATVISTDLHRIANALPGTTIRFRRVEAKEACLIARDFRDRLEIQKQSVVPYSPQGVVDLKSLYERNLISGVVDIFSPDLNTDQAEKDQR